MNVRKRWTTDSTKSTSSKVSTFYTKEETIADVIENFNIRRFYSAEGEPVLINDSPDEIQVLVQSHTNPINDKKVDQKMHSPMDANIYRGSYIDRIVDSAQTRWLGMSRTSIVGNAYKSIQIQETNNDFKFLDENGKVQSFRCVIENKLNETKPDHTKAINTPEGTIFVHVQHNDITKQINDNKRFLFGNRGEYEAFKVNGRQNFIDENYVRFTMYVDQIDYDRDDLINGIANAFELVYSLNITADDFTQQVGYTGQLEYVLIVNGDDSDKPVVWSSSDESIGTVDQNGNIELLALGSVTFKCEMENNSDVFDEVTVDVVAVPSGVKEVRFEPEKDNLYSYEDPFEIQVYKYLDNEVQGDTFTFDFSGADTSRFEITNITGNSFYVKSLGYDEDKLAIQATSDVDSTVGIIEIQLKGLA